MPRQRMVSPDFWTSEQVCSVSRDARLLWIGLWNFADDNGIYPSSSHRLKLEVFPADDDINKPRIMELVGELLSTGLLQEYVAEEDGKSYWIVPNWHVYQKIKYPSCTYPKPSGIPEGRFQEDSGGNKGSLREGSGKPGGSLGDASPPREEKRRELSSLCSLGEKEEKTAEESFVFSAQDIRLNSLKTPKRARRSSVAGITIETLVDRWNELPRSIAPKVRKPPTEQYKKLWKRVSSENDLREALNDPSLIDKVRESTFCHGKPWFTLAFLFTRDPKTKELRAEKILRGGYVDQSKQVEDEDPSGGMEGVTID